MARRMDIEKEVFAQFSRTRPLRKDGVFILLDEIPTEVRTQSSLIVPGRAVSSERKDRSATVVSVGRGVKGVKPGDRVLLNAAYGLAMPHDYAQVCPLKYISEDQIDGVFEGRGTEEDYDHYEIM